MNGHAVAKEDFDEEAMAAAAERKVNELRALEEPAHKQATTMVNGAGLDQTAVQKAEALLDAQTRQIVGVMIRGILVSCPGITLDVICRSMARVTGSLLADAVRADLALMLRHRSGIKDAFDAGVKSTKIEPMAAPPPKR